MQSEKANEYVQLFESIRSRVGNDDVALAIVEQIGKDHRVEQMRNGRSGSYGVNGTNGNGESNREADRVPANARSERPSGASDEAGSLGDD